LVYVQTLIAEAPVEGCNERVFDRFPRANEIELDAAVIRPVLEGPRLKLRAVIDRD
jgi:hypothetical protein